MATNTLPSFFNLPSYATAKHGLAPHAFYLPEATASSADCAIDVNGTRLPVHKFVLLMCSKVMLDMHDSGTDMSTPIPWDGCCLIHALAFLRFCYCGHAINADNIQALVNAELFGGVLDLANKLDSQLLCRSILGMLGNCRLNLGQAVRLQHVIARAATTLDGNMGDFCYGDLYIDPAVNHIQNIHGKITNASAAFTALQLGDSVEMLRAALITALVSGTKPGDTSADQCTGPLILDAIENAKAQKFDKEVAGGYTWRIPNFKQRVCSDNFFSGSGSLELISEIFARRVNGVMCKFRLVLDPLDLDGIGHVVMGISLDLVNLPPNTDLDVTVRCGMRACFTVFSVEDHEVHIGSYSDERFKFSERPKTWVKWLCGLEEAVAATDLDGALIIRIRLY